MCNYLNNYNNLNGCSLYSQLTSIWKMYKKCIPYLSGKFSKLYSNKKKSLWFQSKPISLYPCPLVNCKSFFFLKFSAKKGEGKIVLTPLNFSKWGGQLPQLLRPLDGIGEVRTADSHGAPAFMSAWIFSWV